MHVYCLHFTNRLGCVYVCRTRIIGNSRVGYGSGQQNNVGVTINGTGPVPGYRPYILAHAGGLDITSLTAAS